MAIDIPPELQAFVQQELMAGRYQSEQELVREALRMLQREQEDTLAGIHAGLADVAAGNVQPLDEAFAEIRRASSAIDES